ncbi:MAG: trypsin-like serine protease, partial [Planctomycetota bacterium]
PEVNMALLRLDKVVKKIKPIELYRGNQEEGQLMRFVGYGDTGDGRTAPKHTDRKRRAATNIVEKFDDDHLYFTFDEPPSGTELDGVSGPGDSGGPALLEVDGRMLLGGISSASMGDPGRYGITEVHARVSPHIAWIEKSMAARD